MAPRYFFTADEHYGHRNIIRYCNRPFASVGEMNEALIKNHNAVVTARDIVIHAGDTFWGPRKRFAERILPHLNGSHIFLRGSHDDVPKDVATMWEQAIGDDYVVVCHYAMRTWPRSHYGSIQLFGHSHGKLVVPEDALQMDVGVDCCNYTPVAYEQVLAALDAKIKKRIVRW